MISEAMTIVQAATPRTVELARARFREYEDLALHGARLDLVPTWVSSQ